MHLHLLLIGALVFALIAIAIKANNARQLKVIERYYFHKGIRQKLSQKYPHLTEPQLDLVFDGLRDYFCICHMAKRHRVSMPSQVVDDAWHEFILSTRSYQKFCNKALGRFLHHTPAVAMPTPTLAKDGIKRCWRLACALEQINPKKPERLPRIFAMDGLLNIDHGFNYQLDCKKNPAEGYCAGHIGCSSGCSGSTGDSNDSSDSDSSGDASGCSSGCGGGCGGD